MKLSLVFATMTSFLASTATAQMVDCDYKTRFYGTTGTIEVRGGEPVGYYTPNYVASNISMDSDVIRIDQATLSNVVYGKTQNGNWAIQGNWKLGSNRKKNVVFVCR